MKRIATLAVGALLASACAEYPLDPPTASDAPAQAAVDALPGEYIVVFQPSVADAPGLARRLAAAHGGQIRFTYQHALKGFAASLPEAAVTALRTNPNVAYVEPDGPVWAIGTQTNPPSWGLDRVDQRDLSLNQSYTWGPTGSGVRAYIIDTGIRFSHVDFEGRATSGFDAVDGGTADDCNGHGTHVAGTTGGATYGIAKNVGLVAVRVLDCNGSGTFSGVIAGIDWVTANRVRPAVANMSLGGGASQSLDDAVRNSMKAGVTYALAAGNGSGFGPFISPDDACTTSPARVGKDPGALTVGATTSSDDEASFSNYGACVDILAPGVSITSAWDDSDTDANTISGTSMAAPHVAGAAALFLEANSTASPSQVEEALVGNASQGKIDLHSASQSGGTPNLLLYTAFLNGDGGGGGGGTDPTAPAAPSDLTATAASTSQIDLSWTDNANDEDGFAIEESDDGASFTNIATVGANATSFSRTGLGESVTRHYRVQAFNAAGASAYSNVANATTLTSDPGGGAEMHVGDLDGTASRKGKSSNWEAFVTVLVVDAGGTPVSNATVQVSWTGPATGSVAGVTGSDGRVTLTSGTVSGSTDITFTVDTVSHATFTYAQVDNVQSSITVASPVP